MRKVPRSSEIFIRLSSAHGRVERMFVAHVVTTLGGREEASRWISRTTPPVSAQAEGEPSPRSQCWRCSCWPPGGSSARAAKAADRTMSRRTWSCTRCNWRAASGTAHLQRHPGDTERLHPSTSPRPRTTARGRWATSCAATRTVVSAFTRTRRMGRDTPSPGARRSRSGNPRGGDLVATETGTGDNDALDPSLDSSHYAFELIPPPTIQAGVVNAQHVDPTKDDHPRWMRDMWSEKTAAVAVSGSELDSKLESIPDELSAIVRPGQSLFVTFATWSVKDFVVNWLASARNSTCARSSSARWTSDSRLLRRAGACRRCC